MLFDKTNRELSLHKNKNKNNNFYEYTEVLPPSDKNETSDIEKRFQKPLKELSRVQKELNSLDKEMKHRIREVRKENKDEFDFEKDMYKTRASVLDSKIKISDKKARIIKDMLHTELKDKQQQKDNMGISNGSNRPDMRGNYAQYFLGENTQNMDEGIDKDFLSNPEGYSSNDYEEPTQNTNNQKTQKDNNINDDGDFDSEELKNKYGLDYNGSASNLKHRDEHLNEIIHIDPNDDVYWVEVQDTDGNIVDGVRRKHIEQLGELTLDKDEGVIIDEFNNTYEYVEDKTENMPKYYHDMWDSRGAFDEE